MHKAWQLPILVDLGETHVTCVAVGTVDGGGSMWVSSPRGDGALCNTRAVQDAVRKPSRRGDGAEGITNTACVFITVTFAPILRRSARISTPLTVDKVRWPTWTLA